MDFSYHSGMDDFSAVFYQLHLQVISNTFDVRISIEETDELPRG